MRFFQFCVNYFLFEIKYKSNLINFHYQTKQTTNLTTVFIFLIRCRIQGRIQRIIPVHASFSLCPTKLLIIWIKTRWNTMYSRWKPTRKMNKITIISHTIFTTFHNRWKWCDKMDVLVAFFAPHTHKTTMDIQNVSAIYMYYKSRMFSNWKCINLCLNCDNPLYIFSNFSAHLFIFTFYCKNDRFNLLWKQN